MYLRFEYIIVMILGPRVRNPAVGAPIMFAENMHK